MMTATSPCSFVSVDFSILIDVISVCLIVIVAVPVKIRMFRCQALIMPVGTADLYRITQLSSSRKNHAILKTSARLSRRADVSYFSIYLFRKVPIFSASFMPLSYIICSFSWLLLSVDRPQISSGATMSSLPSF